MQSRILITGGAGFIGSNAAKAFMEDGHDVVILDDLSRKGADKNLEWLNSSGYKFSFVRADIRDQAAVENCFKAYSNDIILHTAAQVGVPSSIVDPFFDFRVNAFGTLVILEAVRRYAPAAIFMYTSTNKVYGNMRAVKIAEGSKRYDYEEMKTGISEKYPLDFYSPYGCSKGCADQYVMDYARIYGLRTVNLRQSCIYGPQQFGNEDQGWVAHFAASAILGRKITIYGNGKQVRDLLYIDDLVGLFKKVIKNIDKVKGGVYNIGGGQYNTLSLLELIDLLHDKLGRRIDHGFSELRPGDQLIFISDTGKACRDLGFKPAVGVEEGVESLVNWILSNKVLFPAQKEMRQNRGKHFASELA